MWGKNLEKFVKNSKKSTILMISDNFDPTQGYTDGGDPPGKAEIKYFYKNDKNRSPGVYFTELHRFTKPLTPLDLKFCNLIKRGILFGANWAIFFQGVRHSRGNVY